MLINRQEFESDVLVAFKYEPRLNQKITTHLFQLCRSFTSTWSNMSDLPFENEERVILNVGGIKYETFVSTLLKYPDSLLGTMFNERNRQLAKPDAKNEYFFDRNGQIFTVVLDFYRSIPHFARLYQN
ncbi:BTB/POZ protein [Paraphysoderma sedebokerense]|nr:BTB/POZ protein [Paraphysoderma sedebokerense]